MWTKQADGSYTLTMGNGFNAGWAKQVGDGWIWGYQQTGTFFQLSFDASVFPPPLEWPWPPG